MNHQDRTIDRWNFVDILQEIHINRHNPNFLLGSWTITTVAASEELTL